MTDATFFSCRRRVVLAASVFAVVPMTRASDLPALFRYKAFNAAMLAMAVNHCVRLGEVAATEQLLQIAPGHAGPNDAQIDLAERVGWVLRILYDRSEEGLSLRGPQYGSLIGPVGQQPALELWPSYPVVRSGQTHFVIAEGYLLAGHPEPPADYLKYCRQAGRLRTAPLRVPSANEALADAQALRRSKTWRALVWQGERASGSSHNKHEAHAWSYVRAQATTIDAK